MDITLSILIPTRNRKEEITSLLSIIDKCKHKNIEFIISDNSDKPLELKSFDSLKYIHPKKILNMSENWNLLLSKASGKYLTFLGDDDAFIPTELEKLAIYAESSFADIIWTNHAGYGWPIENQDGNFFQIIEKNSKKLKLERLRQEVLKINHRIDVPVPYSRVLFNRKILDNFLKKFPDEKFCTRIPDISAGVKIALLSQTQENYNRTVFISGASKSSNGRTFINNKILVGPYDFANLKFNPYPSGKLSKLKMPIPLGFIALYEAFNSSISQLGLNSYGSETWIVFKSVYFTTDVKRQKIVSDELWPEHRNVILIAYLFHVLFAKVGKNLNSKRLKYINLGIGLLFRRKKIVSVVGPGISNTDKLVNYLEKSNLWGSKNRKISLFVD
jgi:glycosyltransferase involved in cell wall biosynthesis